jgi:hypothetical protein
MKTEQDKPAEKQPTDDIWEFIAYYRKKTINETVEKLAFERLVRMTPERRQEVYNWLMDNHHKNFGLDIQAINDAMTHIRGYETAFVPARMVTCECCGLEYQHKDHVSADDKLQRGIFDTCPRCAYDPEKTLRAQKFFAKNAKEPEGYTAELQTHRDNWIAMGQQWRYNREDQLLIERIRAEGTEEEKEILSKIEVERLEKIKAQYAERFPSMANILGVG